ncbi:MAG TPA: hypothetical protein VFG54_04225 [Prolixibacteraceae bacterium]|nr:hypothetical protein [Prolixibacteraceae bacterium]
MKPLFTALALFFCLLSFGQATLSVQTNEIAQVNTMENLLRELSYTRELEPKVENIEGSVYLNEEFIDGTVALTTGANYSKIPLRYNVYNEEIEFRNTRGQLFNINNPEGIQALTIGESKFIYTECKLKKENKKLFVEVLSEGNVSLLKHHRLKLMPAKNAQTHTAAQPPKLVKIPSEYMIKTLEGSTMIFKNEKELLNLLADKREAISALIDQQKLSVNKEEDLIKIMDYYNGK